MTDRETAAYRSLWASVALTVLNDHRMKIRAAARRDRHAGRSKQVVRSLEAELASARSYIESRDFQQVCDMAGIRVDPSRAMAWLSDIHRPRIDSGVAA